MRFLKSLFKERKVIFNLAKNDFKSRYAGSFFGITWAFVQPCVTILIYAFVFGANIKTPQSNITDVPFILFLISGIIPWFFFNDAVNSATNSVVEYSYILKKMVFNANALPVVKIVSAFFVHMFFIGLGIVMFLIFRKPLSISLIQVVYYSLCVFILSLAISYITSSLVVFFKDFSQIVNILTQFSLWLTPIMYQITDRFDSAIIRTILKLNPLYYIVEGYRDAFYRTTWFFQKPELTLYFWTVTIVLLVIGIQIFKRLSSSFVDVL